MSCTRRASEVAEVMRFVEAMWMEAAAEGQDTSILRDQFVSLAAAKEAYAKGDEEGGGFYLSRALNALDNKPPARRPHGACRAGSGSAGWGGRPRRKPERRM
jgi:hypothetical protein